jgi:hypothetical protein
MKNFSLYSNSNKRRLYAEKNYDQEEKRFHMVQKFPGFFGVGGIFNPAVRRRSGSSALTASSTGAALAATAP